MGKFVALSTALICAVAAGCCVQVNIVEDQNAALIEQNKDMQQQVSVMISRNNELKHKLVKLQNEEAHLLLELRENGLVYDPAKWTDFDDTTLFHSECSQDLTGSETLLLNS